MQMLQVCIDNKINVGKWYEALLQNISFFSYAVVVQFLWEVDISQQARLVFVISG